MATHTIFSYRKNIVLGIIISVAFVFVVRLFYMQVIDDSWKEKAITNAMRRKVTPAPRGVIYDRNGEKLVDNENSYDLYVIPRMVKEIDT